MGRRRNFKGRPGILTTILFAACLTIFYMSWKLLISQDAKEVDSAQLKSSFDYSSHQEKISKNSDGQGKDSSLGNVLTSETYAASLFWKFETTGDKELSKKSVISKDSIKMSESSETKSSPADVKKLYGQSGNSIVRPVTSMERYVHLDLKGAPPNMHYLQTFIHLIKRLGATGLLVEYEDMFPYTGMLEHIRANNAYSKENIQELVKYAERAGLSMIPLVPTFGHMEFVLKSKFSPLRESDYTPQVIDITQNASYALISEMIKQILNDHPRASHLHIGCNEVYELGRGASSTEMQRRNLSVSQMFLQHVLRVANIVKEQAPSVTPVIWDDELRQISSRDLKDSGLSSVVEIMVWQYSTDVLRSISKDVWDKYASVFNAVWIASSFKGSTGAAQIFAEPNHHLSNHLSWLNVIAAYGNQLTFKGVVLTGRQRYDHFSTLCELLPVAVPSLAVCLATMVNGGFTKDIHISASKLIDCKQPIELNLPKSYHNFVFDDCRFPGYELYYAVKELYQLIVSDPFAASLMEGWLSDFQVAHAFSSPGWLNVLARSLTEQNSSYYEISVSLKRFLINIYSEDTVDEWIEEHIQPRLRHIDLLQGKIRPLQQKRSWPRRPLLPVVAVREITHHNVDSTNTENNYHGHQIDINMLPASQIAQSQSAQPVILKTKSFEKYIDDKVATVSQNQQNQFQEKPLNEESDQKKTFVSYSTPHTSNDLETTQKNRVSRNMFAGNTIDMPYLRSKDSKQSGVINNGDDTIGNNSLFTLDERKGDNSSMDKNIPFV